MSDDTLIAKLRPTYSKLIGLVDRFGLRYYEASILTRTFSKPADSPFTGPYSGDGYTVESEIPITEKDGYRCNVQRLTKKDRQTFAAGFPDDCEFTLAVTRSYDSQGGGGYTADLLQSLSADPNVQVFYLLKGDGLAPEGSRFVSVHLEVNAFTFLVGLKRVSEGK